MNRRRRGFTLVETVTALSVLAILLVACGSTVMLAEKTALDATSKTLPQLQAADAASQMADDLTVATNFTQRTPAAVTFTVPDRLATGSPQAVTYAWSGTAGDPLKRTFNGGAATAIVPNVQGLNFGFLTRTLGPAPTPAEQQVTWHDTAVGTLKDFALTDKAWACQFFYPVLPSGTASYTLTRVRLALKAGAIEQAVTVSITLPDAYYHPSTVVFQAVVYESAMSTAYEWVDVPIKGMSGLNPNQGYCIVVSPANGGKNLGAWQIDQSFLTVITNANWSTSSNAGVSWTAATGATCSRLLVMGTVP